MPKTVAIAPGLNRLASELRQAGLRVIGVETADESVSAIVYASRLTGRKQEEPDSPPITSHLSGNTDDMVLMLDADTIPVEDIIARIKSL